MSIEQRKAFKKKKSEAFNEHVKYMESVVPKLIAAEKEIDEIKNSAEWKRHYGYFQTLYNRGQLKERPTKANGYKIELGNAYLQLADIEDLLTEEQLKEIKKRL